MSGRRLLRNEVETWSDVFSGGGTGARKLKGMETEAGERPPRALQSNSDGGSVAAAS